MPIYLFLFFFFLNNIARSLACSLYKDGSLETDDNQVNQTQLLINSDLSSTESLNPSGPVGVAVKETGKEDILFSEIIDENHTKLKRKGPMLESRVSNMLACLGDVLKKPPSVNGSRLSEKLWLPAGSFGDFIVWTVDPPLPSRYSGSIEMPSAQIQMSLIDEFFNTRHKLLQCIIPSYFHEQLKVKGQFITPLLLNAIYALSARFIDLPGCPKPDIFFHRAKRLVEDFMDVPRLSTVVATYLLSLYEPSPQIYRPGSYHCRHWIYSGMAFRMCLELGLHDENNIDPNLTQTEAEQRRRIFWACYELDKFQSEGWERPCMIRHAFSRTQLPSPLPEENAEEQYNLRVFVQKIKFSVIVEQDLELENSSRISSSNHLKENLIQEEIYTLYTTHFGTYVDFFYSLPDDIKWMTDTNMPTSNLLQLPKPPPVIAHFHLYFHVLLVELLARMPVNDINRAQMRTSAAVITQLSYYLCQEPSFIIKLDFIAHSLIHAIKIHMLYLEDVDLSVAQQAWLLFYRCIHCMQILNKHAVIPKCHKFLQQVLHIYGINPFNTYCDPTKPDEKQQELSMMMNNYDDHQEALASYSSEEPMSLFQYHHQPTPLLVHDHLWSLPKPTVHKNITDPIQSSSITSENNLYESWQADNAVDRQDNHNSKSNVYLASNYNEIINNYP